MGRSAHGECADAASATSSLLKLEKDAQQSNSQQRRDPDANTALQKQSLDYVGRPSSSGVHVRASEVGAPFRLGVQRLGSSDEGVLSVRLSSSQRELIKALL